MKHLSSLLKRDSRTQQLGNLLGKKRCFLPATKHQSPLLQVAFAIQVRHSREQRSLHVSNLSKLVYLISTASFFVPDPSVPAMSMPVAKRPRLDGAYDPRLEGSLSMEQMMLSVISHSGYDGFVDNIRATNPAWDCYAWPVSWLWPNPNFRDDHESVSSTASGSGSQSESEDTHEDIDEDTDEDMDDKDTQDAEDADVDAEVAIDTSLDDNDEDDDAADRDQSTAAVAAAEEAILDRHAHNVCMRAFLRASAQQWQDKRPPHVFETTWVHRR